MPERQDADHREEYQKYLEQRVNEYITGECEGCTIDWEKFSNVYQNENGFILYEVLYGIYDRLIKEGVLSLRKGGNYYLGDGRHILRIESVAPLYFTREEDARRYSEARYGTDHKIPILQGRMENIEG